MQTDSRDTPRNQVPTTHRSSLEMLFGPRIDEHRREQQRFQDHWSTTQTGRMLDDAVPL